MTDGWRSHEVKEALDLCLACKGCTNDCPVNVDIPTYKAEFLHHYWKGARRPRHAYAFGLIDQIARVAAHAPRAANALASTTPLSSLMKRAAGMAPERAIPRFAPVTLQQWFARRGAHHTGGEKVLLWPDTFSNHFHTEIGIAAVESLESAGFQVVMPAGHVCCGRPLYDYGFLGLAERYLRTVLDRIRSDVRDGVPVVGIEPSCVAVFKDELVKLLPHDDDAKRLRTQAFHYAEFLRDRDVSLPRLEGRALVWGHCHHKATGGIDSEVELLHALGLETEVATGGCCGLAGSWGFEAGHYELSLRCGEEGILPAVRTADPSTLVVADGFSCRTQIAQATGRDAVHVAQVLHRAQV